MKLSDATKIMRDPTGSHLDKIYIPSVGREVLFHPVTTADVKTLLRMNFEEKVDLSVETLKLGLFDKLCAEDLSDTVLKNDDGSIRFEGVSSKTLTMFDYLSFLIGIRQLLDNKITYTYTCNACQTKFTHVVELSSIYGELLSSFTRQFETFEKIDEKTGHIWKFELTNFNMTDYYYLKYFILKLKDADNTSPDVLFESELVRPILYVKNIWIDDEIIEDWPTISVPEKLLFLNQLPPDLILDRTNIETMTLYKFIKNTFYEEELIKKTAEIYVECHSCKKQFKGVYELDNFFIF